MGEKTLAHWERWLAYGLERQWRAPPPAPAIYRLPFLRQIRAILIIAKIEAHHAALSAHGRARARTNYDDWVNYGIWRGWI